MSNPLLDLLAQFPHCRVTVAGTPRRKPQVGDRRHTKRHGWLIRRRQVARHANGQVIGECSRRGRPAYEWVREAGLPAAELDLLRRIGASHGAKDLTRCPAKSAVHSLT